MSRDLEAESALTVESDDLDERSVVLVGDILGNTLQVLGDLSLNGGSKSRGGISGVLERAEEDWAGEGLVGLGLGLLNGSQGDVDIGGERQAAVVDLHCLVGGQRGGLVGGGLAALQLLQKIAVGGQNGEGGEELAVPGHHGVVQLGGAGVNCVEGGNDGCTVSKDGGGEHAKGGDGLDEQHLERGVWICEEEMDIAGRGG